MLLIAGIITYNPDIERLRNNIDAIYPQVDKLIIVDNGSSNISVVQKEFSSFANICYIINENNIGISCALNQMSQKAIDLGAEWLLTLDQDSVVSDDLMKEYAKLLKDDSLGIISCRYKDRNANEIQMTDVEDNKYVSRCITSGSYMNLKAWKDVGGFYEPLFIDQVDFDYCYSLREQGCSILQAGKPYILHEIGKSRSITLFGHNHVAFNHSPVRYYYMIRNMIIVAKRHHMWKHYLRVIVRRWLIVNRFEDNRLVKNRMMLKGLCHGIVGRLGKYEN